jgi:hypothetical protein
MPAHAEPTPPPAEFDSGIGSIVARRLPSARNATAMVRRAKRSDRLAASRSPMNTSLPNVKASFVPSANNDGDAYSGPPGWPSFVSCLAGASSKVKRHRFSKLLPQRYTMAELAGCCAGVARLGWGPNGHPLSPRSRADALRIMRAGRIRRSRSDLQVAIVKRSLRSQRPGRARGSTSASSSWCRVPSATVPRESNLSGPARKRPAVPPACRRGHGLRTRFGRADSKSPIMGSQQGSRGRFRGSLPLLR